MKGVVFQTSVRMITMNEPTRDANGSDDRPSRSGTKPLVGWNAYSHANAATTVTIPYGISTAVRTAPRAKIARYITSAISMPIPSSIPTETTVMNAVLKTSVHHVDEVSTSA